MGVLLLVAGARAARGEPAPALAVKPDRLEIMTAHELAWSPYWRGVAALRGDLSDRPALAPDLGVIASPLPGLLDVACKLGPGGVTSEASLSYTWSRWAIALTVPDLAAPSALELALTAYF